MRVGDNSRRNEEIVENLELRLSVRLLSFDSDTKGRLCCRVYKRTANRTWQTTLLDTSSSSPSSDGNSSLPDEGGSASQVPQASVELAGYGSVVWPDSLSEWLVGGAELQ